MPELSRLPRAPRLIAAAVMVAATSAGFTSLTTTPASADACSGASGVTVVVDQGALGGGIAEVCSPAGGDKPAASIVSGAGFSLTYVQQTPGFVCRINGEPSSDPCVRTPPADAYWGLWWSDGRSGSWTYSSMAAGSLKVPDGGYVAFSWQSGAKAPPGVPAPAHAVTPTHSATPTVKPSTKPSTRPSTSPTAEPSPKPSTRPTPTPTTAPSLSADTASADTNGSASPTPTVAPTGTATLPPSDPATAPATPTEATTSAVPTSDPTSAPPTADPGDPGAGSDGSLPVWMAPVVLVLLLAAGATIPLWRRRHRPGP